MTPSPFRPFPDPRKLERLTAPIGCGVYELRRRSTKKPVLFGKGKRCALRMSSLLPQPYGSGTRNNEAKRRYVLRHIRDIEYRTWAFKTEKQMTAFEHTLKRNADAYTFGT